MYRVQKYTNAWRDAWNSFNGISKNGTFLFNRTFMEYHQDRFEDCSLLVLNDKEEILALLPANIKGDELISHGGLTYGGFVSNSRMTTPGMLNVFQCVLEYLAKNNIKSFVYKAIPRIYHSMPGDEDLYSLYRFNASLVRRDVISVVDYSQDRVVQERRIRSRKKAEKKEFKIEETQEWRQFWEILTNALGERHGTQPVHSVNEITYLSQKFPDNIKLYGCFEGGEMRAGIVLFITNTVVHAQYIASSDSGLQNGALDLLFFKLIDLYQHKQFFSFGISNEQNGKYLNEGLINQKEGFGARSVCHDFYHLIL